MNQFDRTSAISTTSGTSTIYKLQCQIIILGCNRCHFYMLWQLPAWFVPKLEENKGHMTINERVSCSWIWNISSIAFRKKHTISISCLINRSLNCWLIISYELPRHCIIPTTKGEDWVYNYLRRASCARNNLMLNLITVSSELTKTPTRHSGILGRPVRSTARL